MYNVEVVLTPYKRVDPKQYKCNYYYYILKSMVATQAIRL